MPSNAGVVGSIPGQGAKIPRASWPKNQNIKQKQHCNKFNKDFLNGIHFLNILKKELLSIEVVVCFLATSHVGLFQDPMDYTQLGSSVHRIFQVRILEWVNPFILQEIFLTQGSNSHLLHSRQILYYWASKEALQRWRGNYIFKIRWINKDIRKTNWAMVTEKTQYGMY